MPQNFEFVVVGSVFWGVSDSLNYLVKLDGLVNGWTSKPLPSVCVRVCVLSLSYICHTSCLVSVTQHSSSPSSSLKLTQVRLCLWAKTRELSPSIWKINICENMKYLLAIFYISNVFWSIKNWPNVYWIFTHILKYVFIFWNGMKGKGKGESHTAECNDNLRAWSH